MLTFETLGLAEAELMIDAIVNYVREAGYRGVAVVVIDKGGEIIASVRTDDMAARYFQVGPPKAYTSAMLSGRCSPAPSRGHRGPSSPRSDCPVLSDTNT